MVTFDLCTRVASGSHAALGADGRAFYVDARRIWAIETRQEALRSVIFGSVAAACVCNDATSGTLARALTASREMSRPALGAADSRADSCSPARDRPRLGAAAVRGQRDWRHGGVAGRAPRRPQLAARAALYIRDLDGRGFSMGHRSSALGLLANARVGPFGGHRAAHRSSCFHRQTITLMVQSGAGAA